MTCSGIVGMLQECKEGIYQTTEELIVMYAQSLNQLEHKGDPLVSAALFELLDSKVVFHKQGAR